MGKGFSGMDVKNFFTKKNIFIFISFLIGLSIFFIFFLSRSPKKITPAYERVLGRKGAPVQIIEYLDYECPSCAAGSTYLKKMIREYPEEFYLEMRYFPLNNHKHSLMAATYAECALKQNKFWEFHERLMTQQNYWRSLAYAKPAFDMMAKNVGLDEKRLEACLKNRDVTDHIIQEKIKGEAQGINSTPTYFINGKMIVGMTQMTQEVEKNLSLTKEQ